MGRAKGVVRAFVPAWKARQATQLAQAAHAVLSASQNFVWVGLMTHVPHQTVVRRVEHVMQGDCQFDRAQVGAQVPAGFGDAVEQVGAQLIAQGFELGTR